MPFSQYVEPVAVARSPGDGHEGSKITKPKGRQLRRKLFIIPLIALASLAAGPGVARPQHLGREAGGQFDNSRKDPLEESRAHGAWENTSRYLDERTLGEIESFERQCLGEINRLRIAHRLSPLQWSAELLAVARGYSRRMAEEGFFSHTDPEGKSTQERLKEAGIKWSSLAENIASSSGWVNPVAVSVHGWMDSSGHRSNILNANFNETAVGVWINEKGAVYFTEIFLKR